ncbi:D-alanyl-D-alanine carboxypeptidase [Fervidibacillus halotolerans]|uniref:serine-type D-Ala-D-Ala carboxypeptidase n=2 Tax=Fervidibacillus halotolerans TaxID=2980027 RepID=A0A9E8RZX1_9BACI|nr:D-alanyl-D-alanine carboxypeptidase family protein [Fervidibacillus halotolerans]WAA13818.1 D-alanyl-D-alanine carboxypeptidase [Fervidibacillus halotolerans]
MRRLYLLPVIFLALSVLVPQVGYAEEQAIELADQAKSALLMEMETGTILYEKNSDERLSPASMTKIMTMLLMMEALEKGKIRLDEKIRTSEYAASMGGSQIFLEEGEEMTVDELLQAIAIGSANDASVVMAERIAGSEKAFVQMMNERAQQLGLKNTKFQNSTGLPAEDHYSSAKDMAIMARELLKYDIITKYTGQYESYLREGTKKKFWLVNTNRLVKFYPGVDGLKTGFTSEAKYCLTATAKRDGMRIIAVIFGAPTSKERNRQISKMFDYAYSQFETVPLYKKGQTVGEVVVQKGEKQKLKAETESPISILVKKGEKVENIKKELEFEKVKAPVKKGDRIGTIKISENGNTIIEKSLVAGETIHPASWWTLYKRTFKHLMKIES